MSTGLQSRATHVLLKDFNRLAASTTALHHHHVQEGLGLIPVPCILKMKLVPPSLPGRPMCLRPFGLYCILLLLKSSIRIVYFAHINNFYICPQSGLLLIVIDCGRFLSIIDSSVTHPFTPCVLYACKVERGTKKEIQVDFTCSAWTHCRLYHINP